MENRNTGIICKKCAQERKSRTQEDLKGFDPKQLIGRFIKKSFTHNNRVEHLWLEVLEVKDETLKGRIDNDPIVVKQKYNDIVSFSIDEIEQVI
jgi:uncharacterized protein YegJ (DUF2314 family)